jgi:hypothetical protein
MWEGMVLRVAQTACECDLCDLLFLWTAATVACRESFLDPVWCADDDDDFRPTSKPKTAKLGAKKNEKKPNLPNSKVR